MKIEIPYYTSSLAVDVAEENLAGVIRAHTEAYVPAADQETLVRRALNAPLGTPTLRQLCAGKTNIVIVTSDHTRSVPSRITLPILLEEIRSGNPDAQITILIATGLHRATTIEEQRNMFGDQIVDNERILINDAFRPEQFVELHPLPSGATFQVNKAAIQADLLISEGFIEPHFFAGFSGGRKSILPGICSQITVNQNHSYQAIAHAKAAAGVLDGNPIHEDMVAAARQAGLAFILNVALNGKKEIIGAWAGDMEQAHLAGTAFVRSLAESAPGAADIVITGNGGYPLDQNLYQSPKAIATAAACVKNGGVIIMCCSCCDGVGGVHFEKLISSGTPDEIDGRLSRIPSTETIPEMWCVQIFVRILKKCKIILVTQHLDHEQVRRANLIPAFTPQEALELAYTIKGADASVLVIPDGVSVLAIDQEGVQKDA